jgi:hypothetical protein
MIIEKGEEGITLFGKELDVKIERGEDRTAFIGKELTVKVARWRPAEFRKQLKGDFQRGGAKRVISMWKAMGPDDGYSMKNFLLHGVVANRRERRLARDYSGVVVPTRSLLGGLVNIQRTAAPTELSHRAIHSSFVDYLDSLTNILGHTTESASNFGISDGAVKLVDGGSRGLETLLRTRRGDIESALGSVGVKAGLPTRPIA